jgi:hypothetical protein
MKFWNKFFLVPFFLFLIGIFFIGLFYFDLNKNVSVSESESIGTVNFKINSIQRKLNSSVVWRPAESNTLIRNKDTIKTFGESDAVINLKDGTQIQLDENSMIYLDMNDKSPNIKFEGGSFEIKKSASSNPNSKLTVDFKGSKVELNNSDVKLEADPNGNNFNINLKKGSATISDAKGNSQLLKENEIGSLSSAGIEVTKSSFILQTPNDSQKIVSFQSLQSVQFSWIDSNPHTEKEFSISQNRNFMPSSKRSVSSDSLNFNLSGGVYYWKVTGKNIQTSKKESSEIRKISIVKENELIGQLPAENSAFPVGKKIKFFWNEISNTKEYSLEVAKNADFTKDLKIFTINSNSFNLSDLSESNYFWRVISRPSISGLSDLKSAIKRFSVGTASLDPISETNDPKNTDKKSKEDEKNEASSLKLISPANQSVLKFSTGKNLVNFKWITTSPKVQIQISADESFNSMIINQSTSIKTHSALLPKEGKYFWRVQSDSGTSRVQSFTMKLEAEKIELVKLISPLNQSIEVSKRSTILFKYQEKKQTHLY